MINPLFTAALLLVLAPIVAADEDMPDEEFLEFLGSWEGQDDDWQGFVDGLPMLEDNAEQEMAGQRSDEDEPE